MEPVVERALVFTDIVDSTALDARLGEAAARAIWTAHDRQARDLVARHGGREIDRTDGFFLLFESVGDAVGFALAYHAALAGLMKSGEFEALYKKWFQSPIPPKGINLNAPMSKELVDNMKNLSDKPAT